MKKILIVLLTLLLLPVFANADDLVETTLDSDEVVVPAGKKKMIQSFHVKRDSIVVYYNTKSATSQIVKKETCTIADWSEVTVPQSCSDAQYKSKAACENAGEVWTPATFVHHPDFTTMWNAEIPAGKVGDRYFKVLANAFSAKCKTAHYLDFAGSDE